MASKRLKIGSNAILYTVLTLGILVMVNLIASRVLSGYTWDLTEEKIFTISDASKKLVGSLKDRLTVKAFISTDLPPEYKSKAQYLKDMLDEYAAASNGEMDWEVLDPTTDEKIKEMAKRLDVPARRLRYYEKNKFSEREAYIGLSFQYSGKDEAIPVAIDIYTLEYRISRAIRRLIQPKKKVAFTTGHGEPSFQQGLRLVKETLKDYEVTSVDLKEGKKPIPDDVDILVIPGPKQPLAERAKYEIDQFLMKGKSVAYLVDGMTLQTPRSQQMPKRQMIQIARENVIGLKDQMEYYGVKINHDMVMNPNVTLITRQGIVPLPPPFVVGANFSKDSQITRDMKEYIAVFPCSLNLTKEAREGKTGVKATVLTSSTAKSWRKKGFFVLSRNARQEPTKEKGPFNLAIYLQGNFRSFFSGRAVPAPGQAKGPTEKAPKPDGKGKKSPSSARLVIIAGAGFTQDNLVNLMPANLDMLLNSLDVLAQDESLIAIRSKSRIKRPLKIEDDDDPSMAKWIAILLPPLLFIGFGLGRWRLRLMSRKRMADEMLAKRQHSGNKNKAARRRLAAEELKSGRKKDPVDSKVLLDKLHKLEPEDKHKEETESDEEEKEEDTSEEDDA